MIKHGEVAIKFELINDPNPHPGVTANPVYRTVFSVDNKYKVIKLIAQVEWDNGLMEYTDDFSSDKVNPINPLKGDRG